MATIVNARDKAIMAVTPRTLSVSLPSNIIVPTGNITGLDDVYNAVKQVILKASSLIFQVPKTGATLPANISMTAVLKNMPETATVTFSVESGTCTYTVIGNTLTVVPTGLTTTTATIKVVVSHNGVSYEDRVTIAKVAEGVDSVVGLLSNEAAVVSTPFDGTVASYTNTGGTFYIFDGIVNKTGNASVVYSVASFTGVTAAIANTGVYTLSAMTADTATVTFRAVYTKAGGATTTIDKMYSLAKAKAGSNAQNLRLSASSQVFRVAKDGQASPTQITITAAQSNLASTPTFEVAAGTATLTGSGSSRIIAYSDMASEAVTIRVTWDGKTDDMTVVKLREGVDAVTGFLTNETSLISADTAGTLTESLSSVGGTFKVFDGITDITGNGVTYSVVSSANLTLSIDVTGLYTITAITADRGTATLRAVARGVTIDRVYQLAKSKAGSIGSDGKRGNVQLVRAITGSAWSDAEAVIAISGAGYGVPQDRDVVTLYNPTSAFSEVRFYSGGSWLALDAYINGNLLVNGTVAAQHLAADSVTAAKVAAGAVTATKINVTNLASIKSDLGAITAGSLNINGKFIVAADGTTTIQNASTGQRLVISNNLISVYDGNGTLRVRLGSW